MSAGPVAIEELQYPDVDARIRIFQAGDEVTTFAVMTQRFAMLIDTMATPALMRQVLGRVQPALDGRPVLVINTHADWDHVYGNRVFAPDGDHPALIIGHALTGDRLRSPAARERLEAQQAEDNRFAEVTLVPPDLVFTDTLTLHGGDLTLELVPTPGHTPDHCSVWIPELGTLLAGDAAEFPFPSVRGGATLAQVRASLQHLQSFHATVVLPCHGGTTGPELLEQNLAYFRRLRAELASEPGFADRAALTELALPPGLTYRAVLQDLGTTPERVPAFYRGFHLEAVQATLEELRSEGREDG
ncbi:MBL fold metallo-hydrolase [Deinococcus sonorensis]|uniref:MBL fold metallo-hydrolase n=2 Tax=Deinococcus sonorensis TaxID=309891 RepID=A0AAU7U6B5_9DEIO